MTPEVQPLSAFMPAPAFSDLEFRHRLGLAVHRITSRACARIVDGQPTKARDLLDRASVLMSLRWPSGHPYRLAVLEASCELRSMARIADAAAERERKTGTSRRSLITALTLVEAELAAAVGVLR